MASQQIVGEGERLQTIADALEVLGVPLRLMRAWRSSDRAAWFVQLPNGSLRTSYPGLNKWLHAQHRARR